MREGSHTHPMTLLVLTALTAGLAAVAQPSHAAEPASVVDDRIGAGSALSVLDTDTVPSPGIQIGITTRDVQNAGLGGAQVACGPGAGTVHFAWMMQDHIPVGPDIGEDHYDYEVNYNSWDKSSAVLNQGPLGVSVSIGFFSFHIRGGIVRVDADSDNRCHAVFQQGVEPDSIGSTWHLLFPVEGLGFYLGTELPDPAGYPLEVCQQLPAIGIARNNGLKDASTDVRHVLAGGQDNSTLHKLTTGHLWYWRYDEGAAIPTWEGPVLFDSTEGMSWMVEAADNSNRVAAAYLSDYVTDGFNGLYNIVYRQSQTAGAGWIDGSELGPENRNFATTYADENGPQASGEICIAYDRTAVLHLVYIEQLYAGYGPRAAIRHWSDARGTIRTAVTGYYANTTTWIGRLNLCNLSFGIGDGSTPCDGGATANENYLYVLYNKLGGETSEEQADTSLWGLSNGELYLIASPDGGLRWSAPVNLTNTKSPLCDSDDPNLVCASETCGSIPRDVSDIEIMYLRDYEAGGLYESPFTMNDVMYLNIPGGTTDAPLLCPYIPPCDCPCDGDPQCDGVTDVLDVVKAVDVAFRGGTAVCDEYCLNDRTDVDCDGVTNVIDVVLFVNVTFRDADPETTYCDPCAP